MGYHEEPPVAAVSQDSSNSQGGATPNEYKPSASTAPRESGVRQDLPVKSDNIDHKKEHGIMETSSLSHIDGEISESDNATLQDDFSALNASLSAYLELQTRNFRKAGSDEASYSDTESDNSEDMSSLGLLLSDTIRYIQYLEGVQQQLVKEKAFLEDQVKAYGKKKSEGGETV